MPYDASIVYMTKNTIKTLSKALNDPSPREASVQTSGSPKSPGVQPVPVLLTPTQAKRIAKNYSQGKGARVRFSAAQVRAMKKAKMDTKNGSAIKLTTAIENLAAPSGGEFNFATQGLKSTPPDQSPADFFAQENKLSKKALKGIHGAFIPGLKFLLPLAKGLFARPTGTRGGFNVMGAPKKRGGELIKDLEEIVSKADRKGWEMKDTMKVLNGQRGGKSAGFLPLIAAALPALLSLFKGGKGFSGEAVAGGSFLSAIPVIGPILDSIFGGAKGKGMMALEDYTPKKKE